MGHGHNLQKNYLQTTAGHNSGPPQQTYYLGSILFMKKKQNKLKNTKKTYFKNLDKWKIGKMKKNQKNFTQ
jgi:hypothetical protein